MSISGKTYIGISGLISFLGLFFSIGSYAFVRAFDLPPSPPMFSDNIFFPNDEIFGLWMFLLAIVPGVPYSVYYVAIRPYRLVYWGQFFGSLVGLFASAWFIRGGYEKSEESLSQSHKKIESQLVLKYVIKTFGPNTKLRFHLATDWLASCWFFFIANLIVAIGSYAFIFTAANDRQVYVWTTGFIDAILFLIGSAYFVSGSYPKKSAALRVHRGVYKLPYRFPSLPTFHHPSRPRAPPKSPRLPLQETEQMNPLHEGPNLDLMMRNEQMLLESIQHSNIYDEL